MFWHRILQIGGNFLAKHRDQPEPTPAVTVGIEAFDKRYPLRRFIKVPNLKVIGYVAAGHFAAISDQRMLIGQESGERIFIREERQFAITLPVCVFQIAGSQSGSNTINRPSADDVK